MCIKILGVGQSQVVWEAYYFLRTSRLLQRWIVLLCDLAPSHLDTRLTLQLPCFGMSYA